MQPESGPQPIPDDPVERIEAYNVFVSQVRPIRVSTERVYFELIDRRDGHLMSEPVSSECQRPVTVEAKDGQRAVLRSEHRVRIVDAGRELAAISEVAIVSEFALTYVAHESYWQLFAERNLNLYAHPVLRELVASLSTRANLDASPLSSVAVSMMMRRAELPSRPAIEH